MGLRGPRRAAGRKWLIMNDLRKIQFKNRAKCQKKIYKKNRKKVFACGSNLPILLEYEKPQTHTALRRSRRGIH
jgi:hypothetical protein